MTWHAERPGLSGYCLPDGIGIDNRSATGFESGAEHDELDAGVHKAGCRFRRLILPRKMSVHCAPCAEALCNERFAQGHSLVNSRVYLGRRQHSAVVEVLACATAQYSASIRDRQLTQPLACLASLDRPLRFDASDPSARNRSQYE